MKNKLRSPIPWFGGKYFMVKKILPYLQYKHDIYVEPFGGGASMLFAKKPVGVEVYNDLDFGLYYFFSVLSDPKKFAKFYRRVQPLLYSRELYNECRKTWEKEEDEMWKAVKWFIIARMSFGGNFGAGWGFALTESTRGMAQTVSKWMSVIERLPEIHNRIRRVQVENKNWSDIFDTYDTPETLFYCDPPYLSFTRKSGGYKYELSISDHVMLVRELLKLKGVACLSGYNCSIYKPLTENGWKRIDWETVCFAAGRTRGTGIQGKGSAKEKQPRTESLWIHPKIYELVK